MSNLYEQLIAKKLAGVKIEGGYQFRTNENAALAAVAVVAAWLRDEAAVQWERSVNHDDPRSREMAAIRAMYLTDRAIELEGGDVLTHPDATEADHG